MKQRKYIKMCPNCKNQKILLKLSELTHICRCGTVMSITKVIFEQPQLMWTIPIPTLRE